MCLNKNDSRKDGTEQGSVAMVASKGYGYLLQLRQKLRDVPIAVKVTAWYTLFMAIIFVAVVSFTAKFTENFHIQAAALTLQKQVDEASRHPDKFDDHEDDVYIATFDGHHMKVKGRLPAGLPQELPPRPGMGVQKFTLNDREYRYYDVPVLQPGGEQRLMRGVIALDKINRRTNLFLLGLFLGLPVFILIAALGGYKIIKRGFQPVGIISATAQEIGATNDLSRRIDIGAGGDEIHQMAGSFNKMLDKIESSVEREKRFSADVSHELRTPVAVIMAESEYGRDCAANLAEAQEGFASIHKQSQKMTALINQLLELARLGNTDSVPKTELDFSRLVSETCADYQVLTTAKQLSLTAEIQPGLRFLGNAALLQRVLANYLDNALKFTRSKITVKLVQTGPKLRLSVADDGAGLTAAELAKVWDRFYQTDTSRNRETNQGLGLGLATVAAIAKLHGGRAWAESIPDQGSTFYLEI
jgi:signal transduction histidine kinase